MKKLLSILAAVGLTATASSSVVACATTVSAKNITVTRESDGSYTLVTKKFKATLKDGAKKAVAKDATIAKADLSAEFGKLVWFKGKDAVKFTSGKLLDESAKAEKEIKAGDKKVEISMTIKIDEQAAIELGLIKADGKKDKNITVTVGTANKDGKLDKAIFKLKLEGKKFAF